MTEQQWRVIADRYKGDDPRRHDAEPGDLLVFEVQQRNVPAVLVRIERPVPTTDEPMNGPTVIELASRHCETTTGNYTCADDLSRSADSPYGATGYCYPCLIRNALSSPSPHPPTREQIAEAMPGRVEIHRIICGQLGGPSTHDHQACENAANAVHDALIQSGADR